MAAERDRALFLLMALPGPKVSASAPLYASPALRVLFLQALRERRCSSPYMRDVARYLEWWGEQLAGVDLRTLSLAGDVVQVLEGATCRGARIAALKSFCTWLHRDRYLLEHNPVAALRVPQARPEQWRRPKAIEEHQLDRVLEQLERPWADGLVVLAGTGWHLTELRRFVVAGAVLEPDRQRRGVAGVLETVHKHGQTHRTAVSARAKAAAARLRARGSLSAAALRRHVRAACRAAGVVPWTPGQMRHTVATYAARRAGLQRTADFLGHADARTTRRFYVLHYCAPKVPTPR